MTTKEKRKKTSKQDLNKGKALDKVLYIIILFIASFPVFLRGLFFEIELFITLSIVFLVFALFIVHSIVNRSKINISTPLEYATLGLVTAYTFSMFAAVNIRSSVIALLINAMYLAILILTTNFSVTAKRKYGLLWVLIVSAFGVCIIGIDAATSESLVKVLNKISDILKLNDFVGTKEMFSSLYQGGQVFSTFQYSNALAAYLMSIFFVAITLVLISDNLFKKIIALSAGVIAIVTFILTISRGAYLIFPLIFVLYILIMAKGNKIKAIVCSVSAVAPALVVAVLIMRQINATNKNVMLVWIILLLGIFVSAVFHLILSHITSWLEKLSKKVYLGVLAVIVLAAVGIVIFAMNSSMPLEIEHKVGQGEQHINVQKSIMLQPGKEYLFVYELEAKNEMDKPFSYSVRLLNTTNKDILFGGGEVLAVDEGKATSGKEVKKIGFRVPEDSKAVRAIFSNIYEGTHVTFYNAKIVEKDSNKIVKDIILKYKYIPESIAQRVDNITTDISGLQRAIYIEDGLKIFKDHWLIGAGGGAWDSLYPKYQSYKYDSSQSHSYYMQILVESGTIGLIAIIFFITSIIIQAILILKKNSLANNESKVLVAGLVVSVAAILLHSAADFTLSYPAIGLMIFALLGIINSEYKIFKESNLQNNDAGTLNRAILKVTSIKVFKPNNYVVLSLTSLLFIFSLMAYTSTVYNRSARNAALNHNNEKAMDYYAKAAKADPLFPSYKINCAKLIIQQGNLTQEMVDTANKYVLRAEKLSKYNSKAAGEIAEYYLFTGDIEKGLKYFDLTTKLRPLDQRRWDARVNAYYQVATYLMARKEVDLGYKYIDRALSLINEAKNANKKNISPFTLDVKTMEELEKLECIRSYKNSTSEGGIDKVINGIKEKVIFYSYPKLDVNLDGIPDQYSFSDPANSSISIVNGSIVLDNSKTGYGNIASRKLALEAGKNYRIEVKISDSGQLEKIDYNLTGISKKNGKLISSGSYYTTDVAIPNDFKLDNNVLILGISGKVEIKNITIYEI